MLHNSKLEAKVAAVNKAHEYASKLYDDIAPIFKEYVGQKIYKADGQLLTKIASKIPELPNKDALRSYFRGSAYSLMFMICTCEYYNRNDGYSSNESYEIGVYIGEITHGVLVKLNDRPNHKCDYNAKEIEQQRETARIAKKAYENAKEGLYLFGE